MSDTPGSGDRHGATFSQVFAQEQATIKEARGRPEDPAILVGLAFSGGGVRSATFCLGVLEALAKLRLLGHIDYLSSVSGGGYIGSWLQAWLHRARLRGKPAHHVVDELAEGRAHSASAPIGFLRRFSNYLTPRLGIFSADAWSFAANYGRNLSLNLLMLVAALSAILLCPRVFLASFVKLAELDGETVRLLIPLAGWIAIGGIAWCLSDLSPDPIDDGARNVARRRWTASPLLLVIAVLGLFAAAVLCLANVRLTLGDGIRHHAILGAAFYVASCVVGVVVAVARKPRLAPASLRVLFWSIFAGAGGGLVLSVILHRLPYLYPRVSDPSLLQICAPPLLLLTFTFSATLHVGLVGNRYGDHFREWFSYLGASVSIVCLVGTALFAFAFVGPDVVEILRNDSRKWVPAASSWIVTTIAGLLAARQDSSRRSRSAALSLIAMLAPYLFIAGLLMIVGACNQWLFVERMALTDACGLLKALGALFFGAFLLSWRIDVNEFSMHNLYRNRLVRAYLGASNDQRKAHGVTGFASDDDVKLADLDCARPYPLINATLNLVGGDDLASQERRAKSFVMTPRFSGFVRENGERTFYETRKYAGGLSLGSAMTVSGAAASPNMGSLSSAPLAFLMTVFNVRLGLWLGNPAGTLRRKARFRELMGIARAEEARSPTIGLFWLFREMMGWTDDRASFVYLSDGGHFENLGIYELVRRRCRFIVACDATADPQFQFEDLGNAIRKCRTDLSAEIEIDLGAIRQNAARRSRWHCAVGSVRYLDDQDGLAVGTLVYLKPSLSGDEPEDLLHYAETHPTFPHESTVDQWFAESQFESYRKLGLHVATAAFERAWTRVRQRRSLGATLEADVELLAIELRQGWHAPSVAAQGSFARHAATFDAIVERVRTDEVLSFLDEQTYPEWPALMRGALAPTAPTGSVSITGLPPTERERRAGFYVCCSMLQLMENVYLDLGLESDHDHPDNRGWMNLFRHWSWCGMLRATYAVTAPTYGRRFQHFLRDRFKLVMGRVEFESLAVVDAMAPTELNPIEQAILRQILDGSRPDNELRDVEAHVFHVNLDDPGAGEGRSLLRYHFGFALTSRGELFYVRIQDHLRRTGLGRRALYRLFAEDAARSVHDGKIAWPSEEGEDRHSLEQRAVQLVASVRRELGATVDGAGRARAEDTLV